MCKPKQLSYLILFFLLLSLLQPFSFYGFCINSQANAITPTPNLWKKINRVCSWDLEYYSGTWNSRKDLLTVIKDYPANNTCKITLNFTSELAGAYRLTFAVDEQVREYVNKTGSWRYELQYHNFTLTFDWTDLKNIKGLVFKHGFKNERFYFQIKKENVPANKSFSLDPTIIFGAGVPYSTRYETQFKTLRNPRGLQWYYALLYGSTAPLSRGLGLSKSENGTVWSFAGVVFSWGLGAIQYESSSLYGYDNGSAFIIYFVWTETEAANEGLYYRRGVIEDSVSNVTLEATQTVIDGSINGIYFYPVVTLAENGYLSITTTRKDGGEWSLPVDSYNEIVCEWTKVGADPYLATPSTANYVYTAGKPDEVSEWTFADMTRPDEPDSVVLTLRCKSDDGNDYVDAYLHDGVGWSGAYALTPELTWEYKTADVSVFLDTNAKINAAKLKLIKRSAGASNDVYVSYARLEVATTEAYKIVTVGSEVVYSPSASNWTGETTVYDTGETDIWLQPTIISLTASYDLLFGWRHNNTGTNQISFREANFTGSTYSFQSVKNLTVSVSSTLFSYRFRCLRLAEDSSGLVHLAFVNDTTPAYCNYTVGSGFGSLQEVSTINVHSVSMSLDLTSSPDNIWIVYAAADIGDSWDIFHKNQTVTAVDFSSVTDVRIVTAGAGNQYLSASYMDTEGEVQAVFVTTTTVYWIALSFLDEGFNWIPLLLVFGLLAFLGSVMILTKTI